MYASVRQTIIIIEIVKHIFLLQNYCGYELFSVITLIRLFQNNLTKFCLEAISFFISYFE